MNSNKKFIILFSVLTGGRDGKINILNRSLDIEMTIDMNSKDYGSICSGVRSLKFNEDETRLLVGTYGSEIYELSVNMASQSVDSHAILMQGHYSPAKKV